MVTTDKEISQTLTPGVYEFDAPLAPSEKPTTVLWMADSAFPLPPPDTRVRSFRILSMQYVTGRWRFFTALRWLTQKVSEY